MTKDFKSGNVKHLPVKNVDLPNFVNNFSGDNSNICSIEGTNVISNSPHTLKELIADDWHYPYSKEKASFPYKTPTSIKFWSSVSRINNAYGDRNLICSCNVNQGETFEEKKCA